MQFRISIIVLFLSHLLNSDSFNFNTLNNNGHVGLINLPSARFYSEGSYGFTIYRGNPDRKVTLTLMPYSWLEGSVFYTSITGKSYSVFNQNYKDKGMNLKFRIKEEGDYPALAIGLNDIGGTGIYSSEYIVSSYGVGSVDFTIGVGWGTYASDEYHFDNPFSHISSSFLNRNNQQNFGGELSVDDFFSGPGASLFGGISFAYNSDFLIKAEYDKSEYPFEKGFIKPSKDYSISTEYIKDSFSLALSFERGDFWSLKLNWKGNSKGYEPNEYKRRDPTGNNLADLKYTLYKNGIGINEIKSNDRKLQLDLYDNSYHTLQKLEKNINEAIASTENDFEEIVLSLSTAGLEGYKKGDKIDGEIIFSRDEKNIFNYSPSVVLRPFIAGREGFLKAALISQIDMQYLFSSNLFWSTNLKYTIFDNFNDLYIPPLDTYPNQVRSDIKKYLNNFGGRPIIGRSQIDFFKTFLENHHIQISMGIFEEMFSGYGTEYLWSDPTKRLSLGIELFEVYKRDYDLRFGLQDYRNVTGHFNLYYKNDLFFPVDIHLSYGEYLAGDIGYTLDLSRKFNNGVTMGAFFTKTDVTSEQFGEGSFDKGVYFSIPLSNELFSFVWKPLTKDPGAKLVRKDTIYSLLRKYKY